MLGVAFGGSKQRGAGARRQNGAIEMGEPLGKIVVLSSFNQIFRREN